MRPRGSLALFLVAVMLASPLSGCLDYFTAWKDQRTGPGHLALDYIQSKYPNVHVELQVVGDASPHATALEEFRVEMERALGKPVTIDEKRVANGKGSSHKYTWKEIRDLEKEHRDSFTGGSTAILYALYLDGGSEEDQGDRRVLGAAYGGSSVVFFKGNMQSTARGLSDLLFRAELRYVERAVLVHEFGHILGLVNMPGGIPMQTAREDPEHKGHSSHKSSVMYWAVESSQIGNIFTRGSDIPYRFDQHDLADIRAAR